MADMLEIVRKQEHDGMIRFYTELANHRQLINRYYDYESSNPAWAQVEESFLELKDAFITWQAFKAALDMARDKG